MSGLIFIAGYGMDNNWNNFNYMLGSVVQCIRTVQACCEAMMIISWRIELRFNARSLFTLVPLTAMILCHFVNAREANEAR